MYYDDNQYHLHRVAIYGRSKQQYGRFYSIWVYRLFNVIDVTAREFFCKDLISLFEDVRYLQVPAESFTIYLYTYLVSIYKLI